ncbi:MAG: IS5/IS1182 family transposase [Zetaproteobacteria bacterium CG17_big_fil_post_rev_8_21_14_2_50_50_13]|nr:MAG: DDE transposase [Zetaproteobacteria bacterium CG1_02_53_45]PIQ31113.1 MAG: IS5/IS1182 family transposase [Zetaproteobacteria bacterium CG17_big_fil_post_rev_8_21_14_2_50_50_13]PIY56561.1 MAG: IS5/IS1182 family transposase [Zetaproteobacteria bacterium CG_4_10_14_0_8_um_filter_49_80]
MNHLREGLSQSWLIIQGSLFPWLQEELGALTEKQQQLVTILELIRIEEHVNDYYGGVGRPPKSRAAIARAFIAKMVYNMPTTRMLLERLESDKTLRSLCGWEYRYQIPHESVFSRANQDFSESRLPERVHEAMIQSRYAQEIIGHISRDSTAIHAREKAVKKESSSKPEAKKRGHPKKGEERPKEMTRIERQAAGMPLAAMLEDLPKPCDVGTKQNSKGYKSSWIGYKLHIDAADGGIPITCLLSSASLHDSQAAIPLAEITSKRVCNLYDLMDAAYDAPGIHSHSRTLGHVPIIDSNPRTTERKQAMAAENKARATTSLKPAEAVRYNERSTVERVNGRLKDEFGGRHLRVRGHAKVMCHLMFGILALTADQFMRMIQ